MAEIGSVLGGRYRLIELLGQGGMATIYRANDAQLNRDVAVKLLRPEYGRDPDFGSRFRHEALAAASLNHPNVVAVYDFGQDEHGPFIVMELVDGEDLASILRRNGPLAPRQAARLTAEVARALASAHARGLVHRDVKPGNIMLSADGRVKVADFGIARAIAEAQMTLPGTTLGSVHYFSPEQARGEPATAASDIYSLGIVLFEMLTGRRPFEGDSAAAIAMARLSAMPPSVSEVRAGIPPALDAIVRRAMATDPDDRFPTAGAMADALDTFLADRSPAGLASAAAAAETTPPGSPGGVPAAGIGAAGAAGAAAMAAGVAGGAAMSPVASSAPGSVVGAGGGPLAPRPGAPVIPYADDAYAGVDDGTDAGAARPGRRAAQGRAPYAGGGRSTPPPVEDDGYDDESGGGGSPWVWISGILGLAILAVVAFLVFRLLNSAPPAPTATQVAVPNLVGMTFDDANAAATQAGLSLDRQFDPTSSAQVNSITAQDPAALTIVDKGSVVHVTIAAGAALVAVPDIKGLTEPQALTAIVQAGLTIGVGTQAPDPVVPAQSVVSQDPRAGLQVPKGTTVDYVVSTGPAQSPSPSATPPPTPTPTPTPTPSPSPPPTPSPSPVPSPLTVNDYTCSAAFPTLADAKSAIVADGFTVGSISKNNPSDQGTIDDTWLVKSQLPAPGDLRPPGTQIRLKVVPPGTNCP